MANIKEDSGRKRGAHDCRICTIKDSVGLADSFLSIESPYTTGLVLVYCTPILHLLVPAAVLAKWHREAEREPELRDVFSRMVEYRRHVLAIFDTLIGSESQNARLQ